MRQVNIEDRVILRVDIPETPVCRGAVGVVCSRWSAPYEVLEIEFFLEDTDTTTGDTLRLMIEAQNVELLDEIADNPKGALTSR
jgi:Domain of unknown function (DUF4926)